MKSLFIIFNFLSWFTHAHASTTITPAGLTTSALESAISAHLKNGGGLLEISPEKLAPRLNMDGLNKIATGDLFSRFQLVVAENIEAIGSKNRVIAVTSFRVSEDRRPGVGRYVVWLHANASPPAWEQRVWMTWEPEDKITTLFRSAGVALEDKGIWQQPNTRHLDGRLTESVKSKGIKGPKAMKDSPPTNNDSNLPIKMKDESLADISQTSKVSAASTPWSIIIVFIVAAAGLLYLLVKRHK